MEKQIVILMKTYLILILTAFLLANLTPTKKAEDAISVISRTSEALNNLKSVSYHSYREINNFKDNYFAKNSGDSYFEYDDTIYGKVGKFQLTSSDALQVYNGTEYFFLDHKDKTIALERKSPKQLIGLSLLYNSITTIRLILPQLLQDANIPKSLADTAIGAKNYYLIKFDLHKKSIEYPNGFSGFDSELTKYYKLIVDKATFLPYMIFDSNSISKDQYYTKTIFTNINVHPVVPKENSWYASTYNEYKPKEKAVRNPLAKAGNPMPDWALPKYALRTSDMLKSEQLKGKIVLMEFWIKNCGYCMEAFPKMKELQKKYGKQIEILSVNAYEKKEEIDFFYQREKPAYTMLYNGEKLANSLGIYAYPTVVLLDRTGKIISVMEGVDQEQVEKAIKKAL